MKTRTLTILLGITLLLFSCQSTTPTVITQPGNTPPPSPTIAPQSGIATLPQPTLTLTAIIIPTATPGKPLYVRAFCTIIGKDLKTFASRGTPIIIIWGWSAKTEAQIDDFLQNNITKITLDGKVIEGIMSDGIKKNESSGDPEVVWYSDVGVLAPGQHTITYDVKWKKMIDDGVTTYGPGSKNETEHDECQLIIE